MCEGSAGTTQTRHTHEPWNPGPSAISNRYDTFERPDASPTDVIKTLGELWNQLEKGKNGKKGTKKYVNRAAEDKVRYEAEKKAYDAMIEERNEQEQEDAEKMGRLGRDKEEAMKLVMQSRADTAASVTALLAANNTKAMTMVSGVVGRHVGHFRSDRADQCEYQASQEGEEGEGSQCSQAGIELVHLLHERESQFEQGWDAGGDQSERPADRSGTAVEGIDGGEEGQVRGDGE